MSYKVISFFTDLQDLSYPYNPGDKYPRDGMTVSKDRIDELLGKNNRQGKALIKEIKENDKQSVSEEAKEPDGTDEVKYTKTDINRLSTAELKDLATKEGLSDVDNKSGADLKKELIEHYGL